MEKIIHLHRVLNSDSWMGNLRKKTLKKLKLYSNCFCDRIWAFKKGTISLEGIRITRFLYANEAHNILMTNLGTHERFTVKMRFLCVPVHFKNDSGYYYKKIILGTLAFELSFQKGCYKLHKAARFTCTCIT